MIMSLYQWGVLHLVHLVLALLHQLFFLLQWNPFRILNRAAATIQAQIVLLEEISRILQRDSEVHQIAKDSHVGWSLLPYLDEEETAVEEKDSLKLIKSKDIAAAEKSNMTYRLDKSKTSTFTRGGAGRGVSTTRGKGKGKGKGRGRGKSPLNGVASGSVGKASKPALEAATGARLQRGSPEAGQLVGHLHLPRGPNSQVFLFCTALRRGLGPLKLSSSSFLYSSH